MIQPKKRFFFLSLFIAIAILTIAILTRPELSPKPAQANARAVDVQRIEKKEIAPQIKGFGRVVSTLVWQAIAEVNGKVVYRHPMLEKGQYLPAGTLLAQIDPSDYQLAIDKALADVTIKKARLAKLEGDDNNRQKSLSLERQHLKLAQSELARNKKLHQKGLTSQSNLDNEQQAFLSQQMRVQELENQRSVFPDEKNIMLAELKASLLALEQAKRDLAKTQIRLPIDSQISQVNIEQNQFITSQQLMLVANGVEQAQVDAQISIHDLQILMASSFGNLSASSQAIFQQWQANILLSSGAYQAKWPAQVTGLSDSVSQQQATVGVILEISLDDPKLNNKNSFLINGMFVEVIISAQPSLHWVVPERALHGNRLYLLKDGQLHIEEVTVLFRVGDDVAIDGEFAASSYLILNDLLPAVIGMPLRAVTIDGLTHKAQE